MILVAGSANLDFVVRAASIPAPGETVMGRDLALFPGGKGANQAVASARAGGAPTHMLVALGDDANAAPLKASLQDAGVQLHVVHPSGQATGTAFICVADTGENAITVAPGANACLQPHDLPNLDGFSHLLLQLETPTDTVAAYAAAARAAGLGVVLNAAPAQTLPPALLADVNLLVVNETELATVAQHHGSIAECLERLDVPGVVVTLGGRGCCARVDGQWVLQGAFAVSITDTTGAGDTFCGALVAQISQGHSLPDALRYASAAAALACTRAGAQASIPDAAAVAALLLQQPAVPGAASQLRAYCGLPTESTP